MFVHSRQQIFFNRNKNSMILLALKTVINFFSKNYTIFMPICPCFHHHFVLKMNWTRKSLVGIWLGKTFFYDVLINSLTSFSLQMTSPLYCHVLSNHHNLFLTKNWRQALKYKINALIAIYHEPAIFSVIFCASTAKNFNMGNMCILEYQ